MTLSGARPIVFVHGFLGLANDWRPFAREGRDRLVDLWPATRRLVSAADPFAVAVEEIVGDPIREKPVLVGYSMGARLAMQALIQAPEQFHSAVFISGHPGLATAEERTTRLKADQAWAARFRREAWAELLAAWNGQAVLSPANARASLELSRSEEFFERESLALALDYWSLGRQADLRAELRSLRLPILFVTGANDRKFTDLTRELEWAERVEIPACGHRVPWEKPTEFTEVFAKFQARLEGDT